MNLMGTIGYIMTRSVLAELIYEAGNPLEGTTKKLMNGKPYCKALAIHTLVFEALSLLY